VKPGDGGAGGEHQPVGGGVQDKPHLIGQRAAAAGAVGSELSLMQFDQVLCLTACAVQRLVDVFGRSGLDAGDDEADVEALRGGLDPSTGTAVSFP